LIEVFSYRHDSRWQADVFENLLMMLSEPEQKMIKKFQRWQDRESHLISRIMWNQALHNRGHAGNDLYIISEYGRPIWPIENGDANISHSGEWVVLAVADSGVVGVDIEEMREQNINEFKIAFNDEEWDRITSTESDQLASFYRSWTSKEAVIKAEGKGWSNEPDAITWDNDVAIIDKTRYAVVPIKICSDYSCHIAFSENSDHQINYTELQKL
jgi:4'-phosphopantetheinyl transferase